MTIIKDCWTIKTVSADRNVDSTCSVRVFWKRQVGKLMYHLCISDPTQMSRIDWNKLREFDF
jgi:hypothetical protein